MGELGLLVCRELWGRTVPRMAPASHFLRDPKTGEWVKRKKTFPPPFPLFPISVSPWNVGSFSSWAIFSLPLMANPVLLVNLLQANTAFKTPIQAMECYAGFLGVGVTQGLSSPLLLNLPPAHTGILCPYPTHQGVSLGATEAFFHPTSWPGCSPSCLGKLAIFPSIFPEFLHYNWKPSSHVGKTVGER